MGTYRGLATILITSSFCISAMCFTPIDSDLKNVQSTKNNSDEINNQARVSRASNGYRKSQAACNQYISSVSSTRKSLDDRITDGNDAKLGEFPHMVQLGYSSKDDDNIYSWYLGGSLISSRFVLTVAHGVVNVLGIPPSRVRLGFVDLDFQNNTKPQEVRIQSFRVHPEYNRRSKENDIALLELENEVQMDSSTYPACLYQSSDNPSDLILTGWGSESGALPSGILQKERFEAIQLNECSKMFRKRSTINITSNMLCSLSYMNRSSNICQGSSGSPLQTLTSRNSTVYSIVGVTSFGTGECGGAHPTVFTRVSSYLDWIEEIVWS